MLCLDLKKKIDKNSKPLLDLRTRSFCEPNASQEAKLQKMTSVPDTQNVKDQVRIVTTKHHCLVYK